MRFSLMKCVLICCCSLGLIGGSAATGEAGLIPWMYNAIFGPVGSVGYGGGYSVGYRGYGYGAARPYYGYSPVAAPGMQAAFYAPADPFGACCPTACCPTPCCPTAAGPSAGCPSGQCGLNYAPLEPNGTITPIPQGQPVPQGQPIPPGQAEPPRTYADEPETPADGTEPENEGFRPRTEGEASPPAADARSNFRQESVIRGRRPAPMNAEAVDGADNVDSETLKFPALNLDSKVTWRSAPKRTRMPIHANFSSPFVARTNVRIAPQSEWIPVARPAEMARK